MFEILIGPDGAPPDPRLPVHDAIRAILQRSLRFTPPCRCSKPWLQVYIGDAWREGRLEVTEVRACCAFQRRAAILELPLSMTSHVHEVSSDQPAPCGPTRTSMTLLLNDCELDSGETLPNGVLAAPKEGRADRLSVCSRHDSMLVRCEVPFAVDGTLIASLVVRPLYQSPSLEEALMEFTPIEVVAYWRRSGFEWTPRSLMVAERFGLGVGGSMTARLTRLLPDVTPTWSGEPLRSVAQGP